MVTPDAKLEAVSYLQPACGVSERRACAAMAVDRSTICYQSKRLDDTFTDGHQFRILAVIDDFTQENLVLIADSWLPG